MIRIHDYLVLACATLFTGLTFGQNLDVTALSTKYFDSEKEWYVNNIPYFECSDKEIEEVYYYRWKLYKAHIRNVGTGQYVITEFINHVPWDREPYCTINAASMHHIYEGRWLNDKKYINSYIDYLYLHGGNNRSYSESIADATYAAFLVTGDTTLTTRMLDSMVSIYDAWYDHWDSEKQLFFIPAMPDATEFNIAGIDASGGTGGFEGGEAFRPTINSYQFGNARAISRIASIAGQTELENSFSDRAEQLRKNIQQSLWHPEMKHFVDRYKVSNEFVHYWDFIRGRELAGYAPWYFKVPSDNPDYHRAFTHLIDTTQLLGRHGFRTNEPSYEYYFHQFLYHEGLPGSQWNGPSWPFQTSIALTGMSNLIQFYEQSTLTNSDYLKTLRLFTQQHYLPDGSVNLVENYDPNKGGPIVHYKWSNHYLHSSYNNLIITGLCGIQPSEDDSLRVRPVIDNTIQYFCLSDLNYRGHRVSLVFDRDGLRYDLGKGLSVFIDGARAKTNRNGDWTTVYIGPSIRAETSNARTNFALNIDGEGYPLISTSVNNNPEMVKPLNDGRIWFFPEVDNRWLSLASPNDTDWIEIEFDSVKTIQELHLYPYVDDQLYLLPEDIDILTWDNVEWKSQTIKSEGVMVPNSRNVFTFDPVSTKKVRVLLKHSMRQIAISEIELY